MKMKNSMLALALLIGVMTFAQPPRAQFNHEEMVKKQTEQMVKELGLDDSQTLKVQALNEKYSNKMGEAFQSAASDRSAMRETMMKIREEKDAELKGVLTADQFIKYQTSEKKRMEERRARMQQNRGGEAPSRRGQQRGSGN